MRVWDLPPLVAAAAKPIQTGATFASQTQAQAQQSQQQFNANSHPRGADGRFIQTGGTVQVLGGPDGKTPIAEGVATVVVGANGPMIQIKSPTTGQVITVPPSEVIAAPVAEATLNAPGTQGIPTGPGAAARAGAADARAGVPPRSGVDALGQQATKANMDAYLAAYQVAQKKLATAAAKKAAAAAKKAAAASKAKAAPQYVSTASTRRYYK